jgi:multidrug efflux pump subunit AcrA (membrane-fusion protein)
MGARVDFLARDSAKAGAPAAGPAGTRFRLPAAAVRDQGGRSVVWLVRDGKLAAREVEAGPVSAGFREISRGLSGGERVVTGGVETPKEGMRVKTGE